MEPFPSSSSSSGADASVPASNAMETDTPPKIQAQGQVQTPIGTPIRLAPSSSAFRRNVPGTPRQGQARDGQPQQQQGQQQQSGPLRGWGPVAPGGVVGQDAHGGEAKKGMFGQVSDLIFGW